MLLLLLYETGVRDPFSSMWVSTTLMVMAATTALHAPPSTQPFLRGTGRHMRRMPLLLSASGPSSSAALNGGEPSSAGAKPPAPLTSNLRPNVVLLACVLLYVSNQWARMLPSYLVNFNAPAAGSAAHSGRELMNVALGFDAQQYGLLVSYGFTLLYVVFSFPAGIACDIYSRKTLLLTAAAGWSLATAASAASQNFGQLLAARIMLGVFQAFSGPAAHTLIYACFPVNRRATANSIYTSGIYVRTQRRTRRPDLHCSRAALALEPNLKYSCSWTVVDRAHVCAGR